MTEELKQKLYSMGVKVDDFADGVDIDAETILGWVLRVKRALDSGQDHFYCSSGNTLVIGTKGLGIVVTSQYSMLEWEDE